MKNSNKVCSAWTCFASVLACLYGDYVSVQYNGGFLPEIMLLALCILSLGNPIQKFLSLQPLLPPRKRFVLTIPPPDWLDALLLIKGLHVWIPSDFLQTALRFCLYCASLVGHSAHQGVCAFFLLSGVSFARAILLHYSSTVQYSTVDIHIFNTPHFCGCLVCCVAIITIIISL